MVNEVLTYDLLTSFQKELKITNESSILSSIEKIVDTIDFDSIQMEIVDKFLKLTFMNKLAPLTQTEIDDIFSFLNEYSNTSNSNKFSEAVLFDAVVSNDPYNPAKYFSLQAALDDGKKSVFIKATSIPYEITGDITLTNGCHIIGENRNRVTFNMNNYSFITPSLPFSTTCTSITLTNNSTIVTGIDTFFLSSMNITTSLRKYIDVNFQLFEIASIESETSLTLVKPYVGTTRTTPLFFMSYYYENLGMKNIKIKNSNNITFNNCLYTHFDNIEVCSQNGFVLRNCFKSNIINSAFHCGVVSNVKIIDSKAIVFDNVKSTHSQGSGLDIISDNYQSHELSLINSFFEENYKGVLIGDPTSSCKNTNIHFVNCKIKNNATNGIEFNNKFTPNQFPFENSCIGSSITGCQITLNGGDGIVLGGEFTKCVNNTIGFCTGTGIVVKNKNNIIGECTIFNNINGIKVTNNPDGNKNFNITIVNNIVKNNTITNLNTGTTYASGICLNIDDNNLEGCTITGCQFSGDPPPQGVTDNRKGILIQPSSTAFTLLNKLILSNNTIDQSVTIGGNTNSTNNISKISILNNFLQNLTLTAFTSNVNFLYNFYNTFTNEGTGNMSSDTGNIVN